MIVKAYIKRHLFHLPISEMDVLLDRVEEALGKENINKENFEKLYPLTKIEENENILVEKQNTNIFLLNLLLLVLNHKEKEITEQEYYNKDLMISKLEEETHLELQGLPFEALEKEIDEYLHPISEKTETAAETQVDTGSQDEPETGEKEKEYSYLENVTFSVEWLKGAQQELDHRGRKRREQ